jgi:D-alanine-D-alanine ligase
VTRLPIHRLVHRLKNRRIGVIQGGSSRERPISLKTGAAVCKALQFWELRAIPIDARGDFVSRLLVSRIDLAYLALHGSPGEDGTVQGLLELAGIPYTGSGVLASALAMNKPAAKVFFQHHKIPTPPWRVLFMPQMQQAVRSGSDLGWPVVVKPAEQGSAFGITVVKAKDQFPAALSKAFSFGPQVLVEKYIPGIEVTVGILGSEVLPVVEIVPAHRFYDFYSKYSPGGSRHVVPARLPAAVQRRVQELAWKAFFVLGCRAYGRVDVMVTRTGRPFVLEVNTIPGMTSFSLLPDAARAAGIPFEELVLRIIEPSLA